MKVTGRYSCLFGEQSCSARLKSFMETLGSADFSWFNEPSPASYLPTLAVPF
jgi:hypothetical protein